MLDPFFFFCYFFRDMDTSRTPLSEAEFEEIMNRNRAISSSAISRAVSDASAGKANGDIFPIHLNKCVYMLSVRENLNFFKEVKEHCNRPVYPAACPMTLEIGSSPPATLMRMSGRGWMDEKFTPLFSLFR